MEDTIWVLMLSESSREIEYSSQSEETSSHKGLIIYRK